MQPFPVPQGYTPESWSQRLGPTPSYRDVIRAHLGEGLSRNIPSYTPNPITGGGITPGSPPGPLPRMPALPPGNTPIPGSPPGGEWRGASPEWLPPALRRPMPPPPPPITQHPQIDPRVMAGFLNQGLPNPYAFGLPNPYGF